MQKPSPAVCGRGVNESFCVVQPSIQTSPALLRSSPARSERARENRIGNPKLQQGPSHVKSRAGPRPCSCDGTRRFRAVTSKSSMIEIGMRQIPFGPSILSANRDY